MATALVTGASRGFGAVISRKLAADGYAVAVNYAHDDVGAAKTVDAIKAKWKDDPLFLAKFEMAQEAWRKFADTQFQMAYPAEDKSFEYGSVCPMCACSEMAAAIRDRVRQLQPWLKPVKEGEVCPVGSR